MVYPVQVFGKGSNVSIQAQALSAEIMRVRLNDRASLPDLVTYLRSTECVVTELGPNELDVIVPRAPSEDQAWRELDIYLRAWQAMNPAVHAEIID
jgi:hypothetical protein